jgi:hypothetical protein
MIRGDIGIKAGKQKAIAVQVECMYDKKRIFPISQLVPADGCRLTLYDLSWNNLYTIYTLTFYRELTKKEKIFTESFEAPIFAHLIFQKGMRFDFFSKQFGVDKIIHCTKELITNGITFEDWYTVKEAL